MNAISCISDEELYISFIQNKLQMSDDVKNISTQTCVLVIASKLKTKQKERSCIVFRNWRSWERERDITREKERETSL